MLLFYYILFYYITNRKIMRGSNIMAFSNARNALLSMSNWWKKLPNDMKPMMPADWNACKAAGLLKPRRVTRGGSNNRLTNHIQVLDPGTRPRRNRNLENYRNLLYTQTENFVSTKNNYNLVNIGTHGRPHFVPSVQILCHWHLKLMK